MPDLRSKDKCGYYTCGKCGGNIRYLLTDGKPDVCPECGYGHGERGVNDIPREVKIDLNNP